MEANLKELILSLYAIEAVKFGSFTLKSGIVSPIYLDLRVIVSYPNILKSISSALWQKVKGVSFDIICGVPYTALPIATCISVTHDVPMVLKRKEAKDYGTKKMVEGIFQTDQTCLIVEDVVTSGSSILETIQSLHEVGLCVRDIAVVINRQQGGKETLTKKGLHLHALFTISDLIEVLQENQKIDDKTADMVRKFIDMHQPPVLPYA